LKIIRYEDLYNRPSKSFRSIVRFLGLQPPKPRLQKAIRFSSFDTLKKLEDTEGFNERSGKAERFFRKGVPAQWKDELTEKQVARIVETQAAEMRRFAYMTRHLEEVATAG
jgi:hypothetical protein